jgi:hypothetical protein
MVDARLQTELQIQHDCIQRGVSFHPAKSYHMLGTRGIIKTTCKKKYLDLQKADMLNLHLTPYNEKKQCFFICEAPNRRAKVFDLWIYLFRCGFTLQHKAPSGNDFFYNYAYLEWLKQLGPFNKYLLSFFAENALRARIAIVESIVCKLMTYNSVFPPLLQAGQIIGSMFIVLPNRVIGLLSPCKTTGVKAPGDALERYAADNFGWTTKEDIMDILQSDDVRDMTGTKQSCCSMLHALFLVAASIRAYYEPFVSEVLHFRCLSVIKTFHNRASTKARCAKRQEQEEDDDEHVPLKQQRLL